MKITSKRGVQILNSRFCLFLWCLHSAWRKITGKERDENVLVKGAFSRGPARNPARPSRQCRGRRCTCRERRRQQVTCRCAPWQRRVRAELWVHWALSSGRWCGRGCPGTSLASVSAKPSRSSLRGAFSPLLEAGSGGRLGERLAERIALAREGRGAALRPCIGGGNVLLREKPR